MSVETTDRTINDYLDALTSKGDFGRFFTDDVLWTTIETGEQVRGREAVRDYIHLLHDVVFDGRMEREHVLTGDGVAALEARLVGTHIGALGDLPPTGQQVDIPYTVVYEVEGDRISALRIYMSMAPVLQRLSEAAAATAAARGT